MIDRIIGICMRKRLVVVIVALLLTGFGYYSWTKMAVEAYPDIGDVTAQVITPGAGAGFRRGRTTYHDPLGARSGGNARLIEHAFEQHFRSISDHDYIQ